MRCHNKDVSLLGIQVCCLDELDWEVLCAMIPPSQPAQRVHGQNSGYGLPEAMEQWDRAALA